MPVEEKGLLVSILMLEREREPLVGQGKIGPE
jgi:hypothetical protein